jgi:hypothetical protein
MGLAGFLGPALLVPLVTSPSPQSCSGRDAAGAAQRHHDHLSKRIECEGRSGDESDRTHEHCAGRGNEASEVAGALCEAEWVEQVGVMAWTIWRYKTISMQY